MPTRDLVVNDVEAAVEGAVLDAVVFLSSCDKTTPAHLMAAARLRPAVHRGDRRVSARRTLRGCSVDIDTVYESVGALAGRHHDRRSAGRARRRGIDPGRGCARVGNREHHALPGRGLG